MENEIEYRINDKPIQLSKQEKKLIYLKRYFPELQDVHKKQFYNQNTRNEQFFRDCYQNEKFKQYATKFLTYDFNACI